MGAPHDLKIPKPETKQGKNKHHDEIGDTQFRLRVVSKRLCANTVFKIKLSGQRSTTLVSVKRKRSKERLRAKNKTT